MAAGLGTSTSDFHALGPKRQNSTAWRAAARSPDNTVIFGDFAAEP